MKLIQNLNFILETWTSPKQYREVKDIIISNCRSINSRGKGFDWMMGSLLTRMSWMEATAEAGITIDEYMHFFHPDRIEPK